MLLTEGSLKVKTLLIWAFPLLLQVLAGHKQPAEDTSVFLCHQQKGGPQGPSTGPLQGEFSPSAREEFVSAGRNAGRPGRH